MRNRWRRWLTASLLAVLAVALVVGWVWYWPRPRSGRPGTSSLHARVLADQRLAVRLWVPHPHQNLGVLARSLDSPEAVVSAAWRLAGGRRRGQELDRLPGFGPLRYPPASQATLAFDQDSDRFVVVWRVHAPFAALGRLAGSLARNPWLAGGEGDLAGQAVRIEWRGRDFVLRSADYQLPDGAAAAAPWPRAYLALALAQPPRPWQPGRMVLRARPNGLDLVPIDPSGGVERSRESPARLAHSAEPEVALLLWNGAGHGDRPARGGLLVSVPAVRAGEVRLPSAAAVSPSGQGRFRLPGESLARSLGVDVRRSQAGGFEVFALDAAASGQAERWSAELARGPDPEGRVAPLWLWLRPGPLLGMAQRLRRALEALPLLPSREVQRWRDVEMLLRPLAAVGTVEVAVAADGATEIRWAN